MKENLRPTSSVHGDDANFADVSARVHDDHESDEMSHEKERFTTAINLWRFEDNEGIEHSTSIEQFLFRVLQPYASPDLRKSLAFLQTNGTGSIDKLASLSVAMLIDDRAPERYQQTLANERDLPSSTEEDLSSPYSPSDPSQQESSDHTPRWSQKVKQTTSVQSSDTTSSVMAAEDPSEFDHSVRDLMSRADKNEMRKHSNIFYVTSVFAWTVRPPYWSIALATDGEGERILSNEVLNNVLPKWRTILTGDTSVNHKRHGSLAAGFDVWLASEKRKVQGLGKPWPNNTKEDGSSSNEPDPHPTSTRGTSFSVPESHANEEQSEPVLETVHPSSNRDSRARLQTQPLPSESSSTYDLDEILVELMSIHARQGVLISRLLAKQRDFPERKKSNTQHPALGNPCHISSQAGQDWAPQGHGSNPSMCEATPVSGSPLLSISNSDSEYLPN